MNIEASVSCLPGVGKAREEKLNKLGIFTVRDLLYHFPRAYQNRRDIMTISEAKEYKDNCAMVLTIGSAPYSARTNTGKLMVKLTAFDESGKVTLLFFNQNYISSVFRLGQAYRFWGKIVKDKRGGYMLVSPEYEMFREGYILPDFYPVYPLSSGLTRSFMINLIGIALSSVNEIEDPIPVGIRTVQGMPSLYQALCCIHRPKDYTELNSSRRRFVFQELYIFSLLSACAENARNKSERLPMEKTDIKPFLQKLPFELTQAQKKAVNEIYADMVKGKKSMTRLLEGDVGSGKTVCAEIAAYIALKNGYQTVIMTPTEILAEQHYRDMKSLFENFGFSTVLLTGALKATEKRKLRDNIRLGEAKLIIGTNSLITDDTLFSNLGLVITDEQHRFGAMQRATLAGKREGCHSLVMTATPIPRTLSLIMYGDLSLSLIDSLPPGRQKIETYLVNENSRGDMYSFIGNEIKKGRQAYIVCPMIESLDEDQSGNVIDFNYKPFRRQSKLYSAIDYAFFLKNSVYKDFRIGLLHGKMKGKEKDSVMRDFVCGKIDILVTTTVIEVGVNVSNASVMVIENAERFGLATLHQLRGRVGRGKYQSYCMLVSSADKDSPAYERLNLIKDSDSGFEIAEYDLKTRGPGDIFACRDGIIRQHGGSYESILSSCDDAKMLSDAFSAARTVVAEDPALIKKENQAVKSYISDLYEINKNTVN